MVFFVYKRIMSNELCFDLYGFNFFNFQTNGSIEVRLFVFEIELNSVEP